MHGGVPIGGAAVSVAASASGGATAHARAGSDSGWVGSDAGEALPGAFGGPDLAGPRDLPKTPPDAAVARGWVGSGSSKASPPLSRTPTAGATLGSAAGSLAHTEAGPRDGGSWGAQALARRPAGPQGFRSVSGAGAHDTLWVDPAQASTGAHGDIGGVAAIGTGGLAEGAGSGSAQVSIPPSGDRSEIGQQGSLLDYGVGLQQAIETLHGTIQLAARQGLSQARIALEPEGLGEIHIHLTQTAQGLLARVTAETPVAAQALVAAHAELRQSLSSLGLNLTRLDIGRHGHSAAQGGGTALGGGGRDGAAGSGETSSHRNRSGQIAATAVPTDPAPDTEAEEDVQPAPAPARGTLVDVLA